jgi:hypothetical protein
MVVGIAGCGGGSGGLTAPGIAFSTGPSGAATTAAPIAAPSGAAVPAAGESWTAFWSRRGVRPVPPTNLLDRYDTLALPAVRGSAVAVRALLRTLSGEAYALAGLRTDIVDAGVLGASGLVGDATSIAQAQAAGLVSTSSTLQLVQAASVTTVAPADRAGLDTTVVVLRSATGPVVGTYTDGTTATAPAQAASTEAYAGHLVTAPLLGTFFFVDQASDCAETPAGSVLARACAA